MIGGGLRQLWLRWRLARARAAGDHDRALELLRQEMYGGFARPMARIYVDMAADLAALGRGDDALGALKLSDEARLDGAGRAEKRIVAARALADAGRPAEAEARLAEIDGGALPPATARRLAAARLEVAIARKDFAAVEAAGASFEAWRALARAAGAQRMGAGDGAQEQLHACVRAAAGDPEAAIVGRQARRALDRVRKGRPR